MRADEDTQSEQRNGTAGGPRAMARVLRLLDLLAGKTAGLTLSELSQALDVPKSTLLSSLRALVADGFLLGDANGYRLGPCAFRLAGNIMRSWSADLIRHYVRKLAAETRESVGFAVADWDIGQTIYTDAINSTQSVHYAMQAGLRAPLYASAAGRVLLAYATAEQRDGYMARAQFRPLTPATRVTSESILENLTSVRDMGYCSSFGEMLKETAAIAVPVFDPAGAVLGALMVAVPIERMRRNHDALLALVVQAGRQASGQSETPARAPRPATPKRRRKPVADADIFAAYLSE